MRTFTPLMLTMLVGLGLMGSSNGLDTTKEEEETPRDPNFKPPKRMELIGKWLAEHPDKFPTLFELPFMGTHQSPTRYIYLLWLFLHSPNSSPKPISQSSNQIVRQATNQPIYKQSNKRTRLHSCANSNNSSSMNV